MKFKIGNIVQKVRPFSVIEHCAYGGEPEEYPIGLIGRVIASEENSRKKCIRVEIHRSYVKTFKQWWFHPFEFELLDSRIEQYKANLRKE
jgi:hypothetical protein